MSFLDDWMKEAPDPNNLSRFTIDHNRWDRQTVQQLLKEVREFNAKREKLIEVVAGDVGYDVWQDFWLSFWKVEPELLPDSEIRPSHIVNRMVIGEAQDLPDHSELRQWTNGDDIGACLACITMEPDLETLYDRMHEAQKLAEQMDELLKQLAQAMQQQQTAEELWQQWTQENDPGASENQEQSEQMQQQMQDIQSMIDALRDAMQQMGEQLQAELDEARPDVRSTLREAMQKASDEASAIQMGGQTWGMEPGTLQRLPALERIELAKKLNSPKFKKVAQLFGPMKRFAMQQQKRRVDYLREEVYDVEIGNDLERVLATELAQLADEDTEDLFWQAFVEERLPQYQTRGQEHVAKGGIILVHDGSGSMQGGPEIWAKAIGLCLLHIAKKQKRSFYGIQFSYRPQVRIDDFRDTTKITPDKVIDFAEFFFNGGTDFMYPLDKAVEIMEEEYAASGKIKSDIVFVTDGECEITDAWLKDFKATQERLQFRTWGINVDDGSWSFGRFDSLQRICDDRVATVKSLTSNEENLGKIFGAI